MQTNIELASASGQVIGLPVPIQRERQKGVEERRARPSLVTIVNEVRRSQRIETMVWIGIAFAAMLLLTLSFFV